MRKLLIQVQAADNLTIKSQSAVVVRYTREIVVEDNTILNTPAARTFMLPHTLRGEFEILDYADSSPVDLTFQTEQGLPLFVATGLIPRDTGEGTHLSVLSRDLTESEVEVMKKGTTPQEPDSIDVLLRQGKFVTLQGGLRNPKEYTFLVSPVKNDTIDTPSLKSIFGVDNFRNVTKELSQQKTLGLSSLQLADVHQVALKLQGEFEFSIPIEGSESGWVWMLVNPTKTFAGIHVEPTLSQRVKPITIFLPFTEAQVDGHMGDKGCSCDATHTRPIDATESELINNPEKFSDDPGTFCRPFVNPNRIVGERSFLTILRVTQPSVGGESSYPNPETLPPFPFSPALTGVASTETAGVLREETPSGVTVITRTDVARERAPGIAAETGVDGATTARAASRFSDILGIALERGKTPAIATKAVIVQRRPFLVAKSKGRFELNGANPLDWEGDSTIYQAESLAFGHILEFRVRWRSNGYSLGNIAHSLTLAPRQSRKIVTVQSKILDAARRRETVQSTDSITQGAVRGYSYQDAVQSQLSEWSKGGSSASTTGAAGGIGFALGPVVIGGGAAHGSSQSSSWQNGGRTVAASEEQSLRDSIRQYGESLRKLESMVVVEQSQEELTQAVSEVVRNPNYCHSLTIVYHEILRHLRIDTEVVGARECIFVPLPLLPFTVERALRWRDILEKNLLKQEMRWALQYLDEVASDFSSSNIPKGPRSDHPINYLMGTIYIQLAIERPKDNDDGTFSSESWNSYAKFLAQPPASIFEILRRTSSQMDAVFQREYAPAIAAKWVNTLKFDSTFGADFTLATKYNFNQTVRVDFTMSPQGSLTRSSLQNLILRAAERLSPGSVANVKKVEIHYFTNSFDYRVSSVSTSDDMISVSTGEPSTEGASIYWPLTPWEKQDMQKEIRDAVARLITHLNEHIEYYTKTIFWTLDRDKLYMMLDSIYVRGKADGRSVASVVEREPLGILGNSLVYRVASGAFLAIDSHKSPEDLNSYYADSVSRSEPIRVSLPTSGLYAQSLMDECEACEEHFGSTEWILNDKEPELTELVPEMLRTRRTGLPTYLTPSQLPTPIIDLPAPANIPTPSGLSDVLGAVQNPSAFRDMAGLAGTQANAAAAMQTAAGLANSFGSKALDLRKAELAAKIAKEKLAVVDKALSRGAVNEEERKKLNKAILNEMNTPTENKNPSNAQFEEGIRMLDGLEKDGVLTPEQAKEARIALTNRLAEGDMANVKEVAKQATFGRTDIKLGQDGSIEAAPKPSRVLKRLTRDGTEEIEESEEYYDGGTGAEFMLAGFNSHTSTILNNIATQFRHLMLFKVPDNIISSLSARGMAVQYAHDESYSNDLNTDWYQVKIDKFPTVGGQITSAEDLIKHIRLNINTFIDTDYAEFKPYDTNVDSPVWNSIDPRKAVILIDIGGPDNASVVVSQIDAEGWRFTTISAPATGNHPVSGHRDFYIFKSKREENVHYFNIKGYDMVSTGVAGMGFPFGGRLAYYAAGKLWQSMVGKVVEFINSNGGMASKSKSYAETVEWRHVYHRYKNSLENVFGKGAGSPENSSFFDVFD